MSTLVVARPRTAPVPPAAIRLLRDLVQTGLYRINPEQLADVLVRRLGFDRYDG